MRSIVQYVTPQMRDPHRVQKWTPEQQRTAVALRSIRGKRVVFNAPGIAEPQN
jgi:hypothetical protein